MNIVDIASDSEDFNLLVRALDAADLVTAIRDSTDVTVFAPTDAAFTQLAVNLGFDGDTSDEDAVFSAIVAALTDLAADDDPIPLLTDILLYHVAPGARTEPTINGSTGIATLLEGSEIMPTGTALGDAEPDLADPQIVTPDIMADNGIIQAIDNVLLPLDIPGNGAPETTLPTITELVVSSSTGFDEEGSEFDILEAAVVAAGLDAALNDPEADLTVFAPSDAAFVALAQALGFDGEDETGAFDYLVSAATLLSRGGDPIPLLTDILTYHVSPGSKDSTAVTTAETLPTLLEGATIGVDGTSLVDGDPDLANPNLVTLDIEAANGTVHVMDGVLLPIDILPSDGSDSVNFVIGSDADGTFAMGRDNDFVDAGGGDDRIVGEQGDDVLLGGEGNDVAEFAGALSAYNIAIEAGGLTIMDQGASGTGTDFLSGIESARFGDAASFVNDGLVSLETLQGAAGLSADAFETLTELYVAYFDRAPDAFGLLFWGNAMAQGVSLREIAELFFDQPETQAKLPDTLSTVEFVNTTYNHVLERDAEEAGATFWADVLDSGAVSRAEFMLELIAGARATTGDADDVRTIEDKADLGVSYALVNGLTDVDNGVAVMNAYVRDDATSSLSTAQGLIADFAAAAPGTEATVQIVGLVDDPFAVA